MIDWQFYYGLFHLCKIRVFHSQLQQWITFKPELPETIERFIENKRIFYGVGALH